MVPGICRAKRQSGDLGRAAAHGRGPRSRGKPARNPFGGIGGLDARLRGIPKRRRRQPEADGVIALKNYVWSGLIAPPAVWPMMVPVPPPGMVGVMTFPAKPGPEAPRLGRLRRRDPDQQ